jgi:hypothetical protein
MVDTMKRILGTLVLAISVAGIANAVELDARYKQMGEIAVTTGDDAYEMVIPWDTKRGRGYADEQIRAGQRYISIAGGTVTPKGLPGPTRFSVSFVLINGTPIISDTKLTVYGPSRRLFSLYGDDASSKFTEFEITDNGEIEARIEATLVEMDPESTTRIKVLEGAQPIDVSGLISVSLAEPD